MVKANVDKILDMLSEKKSLSTGELSRTLKIKEEDILKSAEYLEQDGVVKIERKWPRTIITLTQQKSMQTAVPPPPPMAPSIKPGMPPPPKLMTQPVSQSSDIKTTENNANTNTPQPSSNMISMPSQNIEMIKLPQSQNNDLKVDMPSDNTKIALDTPKPIDSNLPNPPMNLDKTLFDVKREEPNILMTSSEENLKLARTVMVNSDPLEETPHFDMRPPTPDDGQSLKKQISEAEYEFKPEAKEMEFPSYIRTDAERITFILDQLTQKLNSRDYNEINSYYRNVYNVYNDSSALGPNEKFALGQKIEEIFERIKNIYLLEKAI